MRLVFSVMIALSLVGAATAQPAPQVTIEDDVSPANAVRCAGLRLVQSEHKPDPLILAARDAWLRSGVDAAKAKVEAARLSVNEPAALAELADACEPFEIRSAPPAGG